MRADTLETTLTLSASQGSAKSRGIEPESFDELVRTQQKRIFRILYLLLLLALVFLLAIAVQAQVSAPPAAPAVPAAAQAPPPPPAKPVPPAKPTRPAQPSRAQGQPSSGETVYKVEGEVKAPKILYQPVPSYTSEAKAKKIEGLVLLQVVVGEDGKVRQAKILRGLGHGLDEAALDAVLNQWKFQAGTLHGKPVPVRVAVEISFRLS
jgi:TonB family protein